MPPVKKPKRRSCARCRKVLSKQRNRLKYCYLCDVSVKRQQRDRAHRQAVEVRYSLKAGDYDLFYEFQGGKCAICQRATGATKRLSVDHDHKKGFTREAVRGLLCGPCNQMLGHGRDSLEFFNRVLDYLSFPPAQRAIDTGCPKHPGQFGDH